MVHLSKLRLSLCLSSLTAIRRASSYSTHRQSPILLSYLSSRKSLQFDPNLHCRLNSISATTGSTSSRFPVTSDTSSSSSSPATPEEKKKDETVQPEPKKLTMKEKLTIYLRSLSKDYKEVYFDTIKEAKAKPRKAAFYLALVGGVLYCMWSNPEEQRYFEDFTENRDTFELCAKPLRNPDTEEYFQQVSKLCMKGLVRHQSLGLFSIMWRHNDDPMLGLHSAQCEYLKPMLTEMWDRLIDVGFLGRWWILEKKMEDYDVNYLEWNESPPQSNPYLIVSSMLNQTKVY